MEIKNIVGQNIKFYRFKREISQEELAHQANISTTSISLIENGRVDIKLSNLFEISKALDVDIKDLLDFSDKGPLDWRVGLKKN